MPDGATGDLPAFHTALEAESLAPLWERMRSLAPREPAIKGGPRERTREAFDQMRKLDEWDPAEGLRLAFTDPTTGRSPIATMGAFMQLLPAGFKGTSIRSTDDGTVYCVVHGSGTVRVRDETWEVGQHDVFVVPSWAWHDFSASEELVLFSFSDRPSQKQLGLWREQRA